MAFQLTSWLEGIFTIMLIKRRTYFLYMYSEIFLSHYPLPHSGTTLTSKYPTVLILYTYSIILMVLILSDSKTSDGFM